MYIDNFVGKPPGCYVWKFLNEDRFVFNILIESNANCTNEEQCVCSPLNFIPPPLSPYTTPPPSTPQICINDCEEESYSLYGDPTMEERTGDRICHDGGPGSSHAFCAYGHDCTDCGPRPVSGAPYSERS
jgi:hypothetical protein